MSLGPVNMPYQQYRFILSRPDTYQNVEVRGEAETRELAEAKLRAVLPADVRIDSTHPQEER